MVVKITRLEVAAANEVEQERRRARRRAVSPNLEQLLREPERGSLQHDERSEWKPIEPLAPARGIALGVMLSIPLWAAVIGSLYAISR